MNKKIIIFLTAFGLGFCFSLVIGKIPVLEMGKTNFLLPGQEEKMDMDLFWNVFHTIEEKYYTQKAIPLADLQAGAIKGMVEALGDLHSEYMDPETTEKFEASLHGDFEGIGAEVEKVSLGVEVKRLIKGSPALAADVKAGDIILKANGVDLTPLDIYDAIDKIKGPAGTSVILDILRSGEEEIITKTIIRQKIQIPSVEEKIFEKENIGYIALNMFGDTSANEFAQALKNMQNAKVEGIIIDLRDNGGGYLQSAVEILSHFIPSGEVLVKTKYNESVLDENYFSYGSESIFDKKIVVLINGNSASASEITAGALKDYQKAIIVGEQSYGKGSVQQPFDLEDGSLLKLTVAHWFTPLGTSIEHEGILPDVVVHYLPEDYSSKYDRQLEEAKIVLSRFIQNKTLGLSLENYFADHTQIHEDTLENVKIQAEKKQEKNVK